MIRIIHYLYINKKRFFTARILTKRCFLSCLLLKNGKDNYLWIYFRTFAPKIEISMNKKYLLPIITTLLIILSCGNQQNSLILADIDSLVSIEKYDSAYQELMRIKQDLSEDKESQAHFYLLLTQTSLLTNHALTPDSLINISIAYYEENGNDEKLSDAYYYKAECLMQRKDYASAIILCKKAYGLAAKANSYVLQYKTASLISHINCLGGNYNLQLEYAKRALSNAIKTKRKRWIAYSYNDVNEAYQYKGLIDSAIVYAEKTIPFLNNINQNELPYFLNNIGYVYIMKDPKKAKEFFEKSISLKPLSRTLENLAYIYSKEGNKEKAYELWKNALYYGDDIPVDKIIYHILQYNLSHSDLDGACEQLSKIVTIKDSLNTALSDRSIEQIQQKYDEKVVSDRHEKEILRWCIGALILSIIVLFLIGYIRYKKYRSRIAFKEQQLLINSYINEIGQLKGQNDNAEYQIGELKNRVSGYIEDIRKFLTPIPVHYEWRYDGNPYDFSGEIFKNGYISLDQTVDAFLENEYTGDMEATYNSGCGWYYRTYGDELQYSTLEIASIIMCSAIKECIEKEFNISLSEEDFENIKENCNEFDPIYDECLASDFFWWEAAVEFVTIGSLKLTDILNTI